MKISFFLSNIAFFRTQHLFKTLFITFNSPQFFDNALNKKIQQIQRRQVANKDDFLESEMVQRQKPEMELIFHLPMRLYIFISSAQHTPCAMY